MPRFRNLTAVQERAFEHIAINSHAAVAHSPAVLRRLEEKGLLVGRDVVEGKPPVTFTYRVYEVPIPVHMEWCQWCERYAEEG
jgi:predicted thioredoxin/glutaredoxin